MAHDIHVGDKIRFLNATGGGVVRRIERDIAWVESEDGFELPTPIRECVVVQEQDTFVPAYQPPKISDKIPPQKTKSPTAPPTSTSQTDTSPVSPPSVPHAQAAEDHSFISPQSQGPFFDRPDGERISTHIAFLPVSYEHFGEGAYECYLINESNYHLLFTYSTRTDTGKYKLRSAGVLEPDTRILVEEFSPNEANDHEMCQLQFIPYKPDRPYSSLAPISQEVEIDVVKFFKRHAFKDNPFFDEHALVYTITEEHNNETKPKVLPKRQGKLPNHSKPLAASLESQRPVAPSTVPPTSSPIEQVGIEASRILPESAGMTPHEILLYQLKTFRRELDKRLKHKGSQVIFVHGAGMGILHQLIIKSLEQEFSNVKYRDLSLEKNFSSGAIEVTILG